MQMLYSLSFFQSFSVINIIAVDTFGTKFSKMDQVKFVEDSL